MPVYIRIVFFVRSFDSLHYSVADHKFWISVSLTLAFHAIARCVCVCVCIVICANVVYLRRSLFHFGMHLCMWYRIFSRKFPIKSRHISLFAWNIDWQRQQLRHLRARHINYAYVCRMTLASAKRHRNHQFGYHIVPSLNSQPLLRCHFAFNQIDPEIKFVCLRRFYWGRSMGMNYICMASKRFFQGWMNEKNTMKIHRLCVNKSINHGWYIVLKKLWRICIRMVSSISRQIWSISLKCLIR